MTNQSHKSDQEKILVLMSGGVDSSTAAALLKQAGHEVAGVYLKLWERKNSVISSDHEEREISTTLNREGVEISHFVRDDSMGLGDPCWASEMRDAARAAAHLGIPFSVWDVTRQYKKRVLTNFYSEYAAGRTPNPDVLCNSEIKFGIGLERARAAGYEYVATGHYARLRREIPNPKSQIPNQLLTAIDTNKDQSYFLWRLTKEQLGRTMFPIGEYTKPQVRKMARDFGLHNWNKKDSQGVCFLGRIRLKDFLYNVDSRFRGNDMHREQGPIVDVHGNLLGFHDGLAHFTVGQRQGTKLGGTGPYFVVEKDVTRNTLIVVHEREEPEYRVVECKIKNVKCKIEGELLKCMARVRYRALLTPVTIHFQTSKFGSTEGRVVFDEPARAVAPGQSIVFYDGDRAIGGGVIDTVHLTREVCKVQKYAAVS